MRFKRETWLAVVCGLVALSCIGGGPKSPVQSGEPWSELKSKHFRVVTDLGELEAGRVIAGFEETYNLLGEVVFGVAQVPSFTTDAVIFQHHEDLAEFLGDAFGGVYLRALPNDTEAAPTVLASGSLSPFARLLFAHELTHRFNHVALGPTPTWLNEGLADYYSTIRAERGAPVVGEIDPRYMCTPDGLGDMACYQYERLAGNRLPSASEIVTLDRQGFYGTEALENGSTGWEQKRKRAANYGVAWLLVHLLMKSEQPYAREFRRVLAGPPATTKGAALARVVADVSEPRLDADLRLYLAKSMPWRQHHAPPPELPPDLSRRSLSDSEVFVWWARLDDFTGKFAERARGRLNQVGTHDASASFWLGRYQQLHKDSDQAARHYQHALALEPNNPEYLYGLLGLYWSPLSGMSWGEAARSVRVGETIEALSSSARSAAQL